jgi:prevent-host-death family protein
MTMVNIHAAKTNLSNLIERVEAGEEIVIARAGRPVARLTPVVAKDLSPRTLGVLGGRYTVPEDFNDPLPDEIQALFEGR